MANKIIEVQCEYCGRDKKVSESNVRRHRKQFCGYKCEREYKARQQGVPYWQEDNQMTRLEYEKTQGIFAWE